MILVLLDFDENSEVAYIYSLLEFAQDLGTSKWTPTFEELPPQGIKSVPSSEQVPKLDLKPLPSELKYAFLGPNDTYPVVISSKLDSL